MQCLKHKEKASGGYALLYTAAYMLKNEKDVSRAGFYNCEVSLER